MTFAAATLSAIVASALAAAIGAFITYRLSMPRLVWYLGHSSAVELPANPGPPPTAAVTVHSHFVVIRNTGRRPARNVRLSHQYLPPGRTIWPAVNHEVQGRDIVFPTLVPQQQVAVTYIYFPPVLWSGVNTICQSDEGLARAIKVIPTPQIPPVVRYTLVLLAAIGAVFVVYGLVMFGRFFWLFWPAMSQR